MKIVLLLCMHVFFFDSVKYPSTREPLVAAVCLQTRPLTQCVHPSISASMKVLREAFCVCLGCVRDARLLISQVMVSLIVMIDRPPNTSGADFDVVAARKNFHSFRWQRVVMETGPGARLRTAYAASANYHKEG